MFYVSNILSLYLFPTLSLLPHQQLSALLSFSAAPPQSLADLLSQDLSSSEEVLLMESLEDLGASISGPRPRDTAVPQDSSQLQPNRAWLRLFSDFMNNQKKFRGRTKKSGNSRGCFGMKLERIGTSSGLGC